MHFASLFVYNSVYTKPTRYATTYGDKIMLRSRSHLKKIE